MNGATPVWSGQKGFEAVYGIQSKLKIESKQELVVWAVRYGPWTMIR